MVNHIILIEICFIPMIAYFTDNPLLKTLLSFLNRRGNRGGRMVSALYSGESDPSSSLVRGHYVVFLGRIFYSHSASLHPDV